MSDKARELANAIKRLRILEERARQTGPGGLMFFVRSMWPVLEPGREFVDGWPIHAIAEHLEAVERGEINRLLVTVPPGFMKACSHDTSVLTTAGWKKHGQLAVGDFVLHYHIDYCKMHYGNRDIKTPAFWAQLGLDQMAHQLTYIGIAALLLI